MVEILVLGEISRGKLEPVSRELLALAHSLGEEVAAALLGNGAQSAAEDAIAHGADRVYMAQHPLLAGPSVDARVIALEQICRQTSPAVVLVGRTLSGRDVGPRLAFRLGVGLAQDCIAVELDTETKRPVATRPVYGGSAIAKVAFEGDGPYMVLVREGAYERLEPDASRTGDVVRVPVDIDETAVKVRHVETVRRKSEGVRLEDARVVVSGGRGLGGPEPFAVLQELATLLGGAVGASRAACDAGWLDHSYQVGLTGKTVAPDLYITVGISGASQHMAGCSGSRCIVAMDRDPDANIFKAASYGVVGDWKSVVPAFIETVRELVEPST